MRTNGTVYWRIVSTLIEINISLGFQVNINLHFFIIVTLRIRKITTNQGTDDAVIKKGCRDLH